MDHGLGCLNDLVRLDDREVFKGTVVRGRDVLAGEAYRSRIEIIETLLCDQGDQFSTDSTGFHAFLNNNHPVSLSD